MRPTTSQRGNDAEQRACQYLQEQGLTLFDRNYRCRVGEIDLIMEDGDSLVFVEVRFRASNRFGSGAETVDLRKQRRIIHAAAHYLQTHSRQARRPMRFDVVFMESPQRIHWIKDAFRS